MMNADTPIGLYDGTIMTGSFASRLLGLQQQSNSIEIVSACFDGRINPQIEFEDPNIFALRNPGAIGDTLGVGLSLQPIAKVKNINHINVWQLQHSKCVFAKAIVLKIKENSAEFRDKTWDILTNGRDPYLKLYNAIKASDKPLDELANILSAVLSLSTSAKTYESALKAKDVVLNVIPGFQILRDELNVNGYPDKTICLYDHVKGAFRAVDATTPGNWVADVVQSQPKLLYKPDNTLAVNKETQIKHGLMSFEVRRFVDLIAQGAGEANLIVA